MFCQKVQIRHNARKQTSDISLLYYCKERIEKTWFTICPLDKIYYKTSCFVHRSAWKRANNSSHHRFITPKVKMDIQGVLAYSCDDVRRRASVSSFTLSQNYIFKAISDSERRKESLNYTCFKKKKINFSLAKS